MLSLSSPPSPSHHNMALMTEGLSKRFGRHYAVRDVSLSIPMRGIYAFLGRNGAGKTTTIRLILGLLRPASGKIVMGAWGAPGRPRKRPLIGALVEAPALYDHLTGYENLDLSRRLLSLPKSDVDRVLSRVGLMKYARRQAGTYSLGMRQRLGIARALLGEPQLLILDEPTNGLDPDGIAEMREFLRALPQEGDLAMLISSHLLTEVEHIATHVGLMHEGRLLVEAPLSSILEEASAAVEATVSDPGEASDKLAQLGFSVQRTQQSGLLVTRNDGTRCKSEDVATILVSQGIELSRLVERRPSLEDTYRELITRDAASGDGQQ